MKAMIFAAGLGTRLKPITNTRPKALAEINGVPLLEITIKRLLKFGFSDIVINVHHFSDLVVDFLAKNGNFGANITISDESDLLLDTGGGIKKAASLLKNSGPVLIHNVDIVSNIDLGNLCQSHIESGAMATLACMERKSSREFLINAQNQLCGWRNNSTGEIKMARESESFLKPIAFTGIHVINPELIDLISEKGVFSIVNVYLRLAREHTILVKTIDKPVWFDLGTPENLQKACSLKQELGL